MKRILPILLSAAVAIVKVNFGFAQGIGVGTTAFTPVGSAMLEMRSTAKGFLMPRMTEVQRDAIAAPATGLLIFQTDNTPGFYYYDGAAWQPFGGGGGADDLGNHIATQELIMSGFPIVHSSGHEGISVLASGFVGIGDVAPAEKLEVTGGNIRVGSSAGTAYGIQLQDPSGTFTTTHRAGAQAANITYTWPTTAPAVNQVLQSDASGNLSWSNSSSGWGLTGNTATNPAINYLGTTDGQPMRIATNATERMRINSGAAEVGIGMTASANISLDITNTTTTGRGINVTANSLTSGTGIALTANDLTTGNGLNVSSSSAGLTGSLVRFNSTGSTTGNVLDVTGSAITSGRAINVTSNAMTTGTGVLITANALTSGTGLTIASSSAGLTGNLANLDASGSTSGTVLNAQGNLLTTGKVVNLTANALTTGNALSVNSASAAFTGFLADINASTSTDGTVLRARGNSLTVGTVAQFTGNGLTTGFALNVSSTSNTLTGVLASMDASASTTGTVLRVRGNAITSGVGLLVTSSTTAFTGNPGASTAASTGFADINLSGSNAANTGNVLRVANLGSANTGSTIAAYNLAASPTRPVVDIKSNQTSGTMLGLGAQAATALAGTLTAINADLSTNISNAEQSMTGLNVSFPATTAATGSTITGLKVSSGAVTNASGATEWKGLDITMPAMTETGGTLNSTGIKVTGVVAGTGTEKGIIVEDADVLISNTNGESGQLQIQGNCSGITTFEAGAQGGADIHYILPSRQATSVNQALLNNGNGVLTWGSPPPVSSQAASVSGSNITGFHNTTFTPVASMSVTPGEGNFLVWFSTAVYNVNRTDNIIKIAIFVDGVIHSPSEREFKSPSDHSTVMSTTAYLSNVLAGQVVDVRWRVTDASGDAEMYNRSMQLMKVQ